MLPSPVTPPSSPVSDSQALIAAAWRQLAETGRSLQSMNSNIADSRRRLAESYRLLRP